LSHSVRHCRYSGPEIAGPDKLQFRQADIEDVEGANERLLQILVESTDKG
jgi:hypothetical protein